MSDLLVENETVPSDRVVESAVSFSDITHNNIQGRQCYGFRIGSLGLLFPENCTGEIVTDPEICPIPHTRSWMLGVMTLRGNLIPVFDLHSLLFEAPIELHKPMVLVLDQGKQAMGFVLKAPPQWLIGLVEMAVADVTVPEILAGQIGNVYQQQEMSWLAFKKTDFFTFLAECAKSC